MFKTIEGYTCNYYWVSVNHSWNTAFPIVAGFLWYTKKKSSGQMIWDACTGQELINVGYPNPDRTRIDPKYLPILKGKT